MRVNGFVVHGAVTVAVFAGGVGVAVSGATGSSVTLAGPQVLRLIQNAPAALSSYPGVNMTLKMTVHTQGRSVDVNESGVLSHDGRSGRFTVQMPNGLPSITFTAVNDTIYAPASRQSASSFGKHWIGLTVTRPAGAAAAQPPVGGDALGYLRLMPGATGQVKVLGHATIDHVRTTHYRVTIDLQKALQSAPDQEFASKQDTLAQLQQQGVSTLPVDIWLDGQNAPRQVKLDFAVAGARFTMLMQMSGARSVPTVTAPAAYDVYFVPNVTELYQDVLER